MIHYRQSTLFLLLLIIGLIVSCGGDEPNKIKDNQTDTTCSVLAENLSIPLSPSIFGIGTMVNDATHIFMVLPRI